MNGPITAILCVGPSEMSADIGNEKHLPLRSITLVDMIFTVRMLCSTS